MKQFKYVVLGCAVIIALTAGWFSVYGISSLFSGAFIAVLIMASALEVGKVVAATFLKQYWQHLNRLMKGFMVVQVLLLMIITSGGIFGFLSSAYQETSLGDKRQTIEVASLTNQKRLYESDLARSEQRLESLVGSRAQLLSRTDSLYANNRTSSARRTEESVIRTDEQIDALSVQMQPARDSVASLTRRVLAIESSSTVSAEIGPLKYVAASLGTDTDTVVKWFILLIILVFDPLAILLFLAAITIRDVENIPTFTPLLSKPGQAKVFEPRIETTVEPDDLPSEPEIASYELDAVSDDDVLEDQLDEKIDRVDILSERKEKIERLFNSYRDSLDSKERATLSREIETHLKDSRGETIGIRPSTTFTTDGGIKIQK